MLPIVISSRQAQVAAKNSIGPLKEASHSVCLQARSACKTLNPCWQHCMQRSHDKEDYDQGRQARCLSSRARLLPPPAKEDLLPNELSAKRVVVAAAAAFTAVVATSIVVVEIVCSSNERSS